MNAISEHLQQTIAEKAVVEVRKAGRSLRRRELYFLLMAFSEQSLQAGIRYAVEHGMLTRIGAGGSVRYTLPNSGPHA